MDTALRRLAAVCAAATGILHLFLVREYLDEKAYLGVLFAVGGIVLLGVTLVLLVRHHPLAWTLGTLVCAGMFVGFVLSRTIGLPGFHEEEWELTGLVTLAFEAAFILCAALAAARHPAAVVVGAGELTTYESLEREPSRASRR